jgi:hypothetical protein
MSKGEVQFLVSFAAGMLGFWLSGKAASSLPVISNHALSTIVGFTAGALVYGLGMAVVAWFVMGAKRSLRGILVAAVLATALAEVTAQWLLRLLIGAVHISDQTGLAVLMFGLYLCFGLFYVVSLLVGRRLA